MKDIQALVAVLALVATTMATATVEDGWGSQGWVQGLGHELGASTTSITTISLPPNTTSLTTFTHVTSFFTMSAPPQSTAVVMSDITFLVSQPGQVTIPIVSSGTRSLIPVIPTSSDQRSFPAPTASALLQVSNGVQHGTNTGAFIVGLIALLL